MLAVRNHAPQATSLSLRGSVRGWDAESTVVLAYRSIIPGQRKKELVADNRTRDTGAAKRRAAAGDAARGTPVNVSGEEARHGARGRYELFQVHRHRSQGGLMDLPWTCDIPHHRRLLSLTWSALALTISGAARLV